MSKLLETLNAGTLNPRTSKISTFRTGFSERAATFHTRLLSLLKVYSLQGYNPVVTITRPKKREAS